MLNGLIVYASVLHILKFTEQKLTEIKGKLDKFTIRVGNTPISKIDRTSK